MEVIELLDKKLTRISFRQRKVEVNYDFRKSVADVILDYITAALKSGNDAALSEISTTMHQGLMRFFEGSPDGSLSDAEKTSDIIFLDLISKSIDINSKSKNKPSKIYELSDKDNQRIRASFREARDGVKVYSSAGYPAHVHRFYLGLSEHTSSDFNQYWASHLLLSGFVLTSEMVATIEKHMPITACGLLGHLVNNYSSLTASCSLLVDKLPPQHRDDAIFEAMWFMTKSCYLTPSAADAFIDFEECVFDNITDLKQQITLCSSVMQLNELYTDWANRGIPRKQDDYDDGFIRRHAVNSNKSKLTNLRSSIMLWRETALQLNKFCSLLNNEFERIADKVPLFVVYKNISKFFETPFKPMDSSRHTFIQNEFFEKFSAIATEGLNLDDIGLFFAKTISHFRVENEKNRSWCQTLLDSLISVTPMCIHCPMIDSGLLTDQEMEIIADKAHTQILLYTKHPAALVKHYSKKLFALHNIHPEWCSELIQKLYDENRGSLPTDLQLEVNKYINKELEQISNSVLSNTTPQEVDFSYLEGPRL